MTLRLLTLGGLRGSLDGADLDWLGSKWLLTGFLAFLTLERQATRDTLMATFWPDSDADTAAHRLSQTVYALRRGLGNDCIDSKGQDLRAGSGLEADALELEAAVAAKRHADAIGLYAGPFLAGVHLVETSAFENWVDSRRARYARFFRLSCRALVDEHVAAGSLSAALAVAHAWVAPDPIDDEAQHRLIELLARTGDRTQALRQYEAYLKLLEADGLEPLDQTRALFAEIGKQTAAGTPIPPFEPIPTPPASGGAAPGAAQQAGPLAGSDVTPPPVTSPSRSMFRRRKTWVGLAAIVALAAVGPWASFRSGRDRPLPALSIGLGILVDEAIGSDADRAWTRAFEASIESHLADVTDLRLSPTATVSALARAWPLDSVASALEIDYLVRASVLKVGDSAVATLALMEGGLRVDRAVEIRANVRSDPFAEAFGRSAAEAVRDQLGSRVRERQIGEGTHDSLAVRLRYRAQRRRVLAADALRAGFDELASEQLDRSDSLLAESYRRDTRWTLPALERAAQAELRVLQILSASDGNDIDGVRRAFDQAIAGLNEVLDREPGHAAALALRGRLRWKRAEFGAAFTTEAVDSAVKDLEDALERDERLARAAADLSEILFNARADYPGALHWAQSAYRNDTYLESLDQILDRIALSHFELMHDDSAVVWCREGVRHEPDNPAGWGCLLEVMAWGSGPPSPDSALTWYDAIAQRAAAANVSSLRSYYGLVVAGVLARAGRPDSARAMMSTARSGWAASADAGLAPDPVLLALEAAVFFRLGEPDSARQRFDEYRRVRPDEARLDATKRMLRPYLPVDPDRRAR